MNPKIISLGEDFREYPKEWWGSRDVAKAAAEDLARATAQQLPRDFEPLPSAPVTLSLNSLSLGGPPSRAERRRLGLPPRPGRLDALLAKHGIKPKPRQ
jgi:hypothetical protein